MNTRFSPSLNGSLHVGHLWMAWLNWALARRTGGLFVLRFDDVAPLAAGEAGDRRAEWAAEGEALLRRAGIEPDRITRVSDYLNGEELRPVGGRNLWLRPPALEGWDNVPCTPALVRARVRADIAEGIDAVIRGEELTPELQLYEALNDALGAPPRRLVYLPRLRVRCGGAVETISKTHGNLQLRDLYHMAPPQEWVDRVRRAGLQRPEEGADLGNIQTDPILELPEGLPCDTGRGFHA